MSIQKYVTIADDILSVTLNSTSMCWVPSLSQIYETEMQCNTSNSLVFSFFPFSFQMDRKNILYIHYLLTVSLIGTLFDFPNETHLDTLSVTVQMMLTYTFGHQETK